MKLDQIKSITEYAGIVAKNSITEGVFLSCAGSTLKYLKSKTDLVIYINW